MCTPPPPPSESVLVTEQLKSKEAYRNPASRFTLTVTEQTNTSTFHTQTTATTSLNDNAKCNSSSRTELFRKNITTHFQSKSCSNTISSASSLTCAQSKSLPCTARRRRPRIKLNLTPDIVPNSAVGAARNYSASAPNSLNPKNICMSYPIDSGYASPRGPEYTNSAPVQGTRQRDGVCVLPNLFISGEEEARDTAFLKQHEIRAILSVQFHPLPEEAQKVVGSYLHVKLQDRPDVNISEHFERAIEFIDSNTRTLVHCQAGISRSATLCLAYLIKKNQMPLENAFKTLQSKRGCIGPNFSFLGQLKTWEARVLATKQSSNLTKQPQSLPLRQASTGLESVTTTNSSPDNSPGTTSPPKN